MAKPRIVLSESSRELVEMIKAGQLVELENWIKEGKSLRLSEADAGISALSVSVKAGFNRLVEVVLQNEKWDAAELSKALNCALSNKRTDLGELLLGAGAPVDQVRFDEACQTMDVKLVECLLEAGADPGKNNGFAQALNEHKAKPLLGIYRGLRAKFPALDRQAALALSETVRAWNLRWTSLLAWAGADPLFPVPYGMDEKWPDDIDYTTSAGSKHDRRSGSFQSHWSGCSSRHRLLRGCQGWHLESGYEPTFK